MSEQISKEELAAMRDLLTAEPDDQIGCLKCGSAYRLRDGCDPTPLCDSCAQEMVGQIPRLLDAYEVLLSTCGSLSYRLSEIQKGFDAQVRDTVEVEEKLAVATKALEYVLPMAKGYAAEHPVGANQEICNDAARHLAELKGHQ